MSDTRLRELERRFQASGTTTDEGAWLRARWQAGELTEDKLRLAAYAGSAGAAAAVEAELRPAPLEPGAWVTRLRYVLDYPAELVTAAARMTAWLSAAWVLKHRESLPRPAGRSDADLDCALALIERGWEFPTPDRHAALVGLIPRYPSQPDEDDEDEEPVLADPDGDPFALGLDEMFADLLEVDRVRDVLQATVRALFPPRGTTGISPAADAARIAGEVAGAEVVVASFQRAVRDWALGSARPDADDLLGP